MKNKIGIIVDSGASLRENNLKNIEVVPLIINEVIDKKINTYNDGVDLTRIGGQAVLGRQHVSPTPWVTARNVYEVSDK